MVHVDSRFLTAKFVYIIKNKESWYSVIFQNEIRNADVLLLKQLLSIHNTIQELLRRRTMKRTQSCHNCGTSKSTCMLSVKTDDLIHRDYSSPSFCTRSNSCISLEGKMFLVICTSLFHIYNMSKYDCTISNCRYSEDNRTLN